jgi:hypothetical protein
MEKTNFEKLRVYQLAETLEQSTKYNLECSNSDK